MGPLKNRGTVGAASSFTQGKEDWSISQKGGRGGHPKLGESLIDDLGAVA